MKRIAAILLVAAVLPAFGTVSAQNQGYVLVGHAGTTPDAVSKKDVARIFLKRKSTWPDGRIAEPVERRRTNNALRAVFYDKVLNKTVAMVESHWQAQVFTGKGTPPKAFDSDQAVTEYVRGRPGAVGYVSANARIEGVKIIRVLD